MTALDDIFPIGNPVIPNYLLNSYLKQALDKHGIEHRIGTVFTTTNRNWEFSANETVQKIHQSRSVAIQIWNLLLLQPTVLDTVSSCYITQYKRQAITRKPQA